MWWYKLIRYWNKSDCASFCAFNWFLVFSFSILVRLIQGRPLDGGFAVIVSLAFIPVSLLITVIFQKYSSNTEEISPYPALLPSDLRQIDKK